MISQKAKLLLDHNESPNPHGGHDWSLTLVDGVVRWHEWSWDAEDVQQTIEMDFSAPGFRQLLERFRRHGEAILLEQAPLPSAQKQSNRQGSVLRAVELHLCPKLTDLARPKVCLHFFKRSGDDDRQASYSCGEIKEMPADVFEAMGLGLQMEPQALPVAYLVERYLRAIATRTSEPIGNPLDIEVTTTRNVSDVGPDRRHYVRFFVFPVGQLDISGRWAQRYFVREVEWRCTGCFGHAGCDDEDYTDHEAIERRVALELLRRFLQHRPLAGVAGEVVLEALMLEALEL